MITRELARKQALFAAILSLSAAFVFLDKKNKKKRKKRSIWVKKWLQRRKELGYYENLMRELAFEDKDMYRRLLRMDTDAFEFVLDKIKHRITKKDTRMREAISADERLAITLRFLATGETQSSVQFQFRVHQTTISGILSSVCRALYDELGREFLRVPTTEAEWKNIAADFQRLWQFPLCIGALDGKHVKIAPPVGSGSHFYNYKGTYSIVLLALADANLKFIYVDVGTNGRCSDGGVWAKSELKKALEEDQLNIPKEDYLPGTDVKVPYVIVADDAFPLTPYIMKPFSGEDLNDQQTIFNYRLSRARRCIENALGVLTGRFLLFKEAIKASPQKVRTYVLAAVVLHNFLRSRSLTDPAGSREFQENNIPHHGLGPLLHRAIERGSYLARQIQAWFCHYFNNQGAVAWQNEMSLLH